MSEEEMGEIQEAATQPEMKDQFQESEKMVPLSALESERSKRQRLEEEHRMMSESIRLMQSQQSKSAPSQEEDEDDDEIMTKREFKKLSKKMASDFQSNLAELKVQQKYPDYQEAISKYLPEVLKRNPHLRDTLIASQDYELAYYLASSSPEYQEQKYKKALNKDAERIIENSTKTGGLSSAGASTPVTKARDFKNMSDEEFRKFASRYGSY